MKCLESTGFTDNTLGVCSYSRIRHLHDLYNSHFIFTTPHLLVAQELERVRVECILCKTTRCEGARSNEQKRKTRISPEGVNMFERLGTISTLSMIPFRRTTHHPKERGT